MNSYADAMRSRGAGSGSGYPTAPGGAGVRSGGAPTAAGAGAMGGAGGAGGAGDVSKPGDTRTPRGAVQAFLNALKAKDRDRLAEATALRSQTEASSEKSKELFAKIVDSSISDAELDELAKRFDGYKIGGENAVHSTGRLGIYVDKRSEEGSTLRVTLMVRKEKKGWGVVDIGHSYEFKPMGMARRKPAAKPGN